MGSGMGSRTGSGRDAARGRVQYHQAGSTTAEILIDAGGVPGRRIDPDYVWREVELVDARVAEQAPSFAREGLCFVDAPSCLEREPPLTRAAFERLRPRYEAELAELLTRELGARASLIFDHTLRTESQHGEGRPPSYHVHCDYNRYSASKRLRELLGAEQAARWLAGALAIVNVWRPLAVVERAPIGFIRPRSMAPRDWVEVDIVFPDRRGQIRGVAYDPDHEWVWLSAMRPSEAALFTVYASHSVEGVAHAAVELVSEQPEARARRSVESRAFVRLS